MIRSLLERKANPQSYRYTGWNTLGRRYEPNAPVVDDHTVLGIPAAWRSVDYICNTVASMPLHAYVNDRRMVTTPKLLDRPNSLEERAESIQSIVYSLIMRGDAYLLLGGWDELLRPSEFEVVHPDAVSIDTSSGEALFRIGDSEPLTRYEVVHIRYLKVPGSVYGVGPVEACRLGLAGVLAVQDFGRRSFTDSAMPTGVLTIDEPNLTPEQADETKARFLANISNREPIVLNSKMSLAPMGFSPKDAQFLEAEKHSITDVSNIFGVPVTRLGGEGSSMTYQNIEQDNMAFLRDTITRYLTAIEAPLSRLLPGNQVARFNPDAYLRMDTKSRYEAHAVALSAGFMTPNEVRAMEHLEPIEGGDQLPAKQAPPVPQQEDDNEPTEGTDDEQ